MTRVPCARRDRNRQMILAGRNRASGVRTECAIRIVGFVEIQDHLTVFRRFRVDVTASAICFFPGSLVAEHHEKLVTSHERLQSQRLPFELEHQFARSCEDFSRTTRVRYLDFLFLRISAELRFYFVCCVDWKPGGTFELAQV